MKRARRRQLPRLYVPVLEPEDVVRHLGRQEDHWKEGYSAHALVTKWFSANGIPEAVKSALSKHDQFRGAEFIDGFFERQVDLQSAGRPSQTDLLAIINVGSRVAVMAVEGKVDEPFGELVRDWLEGRKRKTSEPAILSERGARAERLEGLWRTLGMKEPATHELRYQLLHRAASAIYEAKRYRTDLVVMLVHSFSERASGFSDFRDFAKALGIKEEILPGTLAGPVKRSDVSLFVGWVQDSLPQSATPSRYVENLRSYVQRLTIWCDRVRAVCDKRFPA